MEPEVELGYDRKEKDAMTQPDPTSGVSAPTDFGPVPKNLENTLKLPKPRPKRPEPAKAAAEKEEKRRVDKTQRSTYSSVLPTAPTNAEPHLSIDSPAASTQIQESSQEAMVGWFGLAWELWTEALVAQMEGRGLGPDTGNAVLSFPQVLGFFATLLQSKDLGGTDANPHTDKHTLTPTAHIGPTIRRIVFHSSTLPAVTLQSLFNHWEKELKSRALFTWARRLLVSQNQSHSYSLSAFRLLSSQKLEVHIMEHETDEEMAEESAEQVKWVASQTSTRPPTNLFTAAGNPFSLTELSRKRALVVSFASSLTLPLDPRSFQSAGRQPFSGYNGLRYFNLKSVPYIAFRRPASHIRGSRLHDLHNWGIWELPTESGSAAIDVYVIASPTKKKLDKEDYSKLVKHMTFKAARRWVSTLKKTSLPRDGVGWDVPELLIPSCSVFPEQPLSLKESLAKVRLENLFCETTDLGELSPQGHLAAWLGVDVIRLPRPTLSSITLSTADDGVDGRLSSLPFPDDALILRSTTFLLVWDRARNLPITLARIARPSNHWDTTNTSDDSNSTPNSTSLLPHPNPPSIFNRLKHLCHIL